MPPKVKKFIWRACRNYLPTRQRLKDKGVNCSLDCVLCESNIEDNFHLFFKCPSSCNIWSMSTMAATVTHLINQGNAFSTTIFNILQVVSESNGALFCCTMWSIWKQRNKKLWNDKIDDNTHVVDRAKPMLDEWLAARVAHNLTTAIARPVGRSKWLKPQQGRFKCNIDASFSK